MLLKIGNFFQIKVVSKTVEHLMKLQKVTTYKHYPILWEKCSKFLWWCGILLTPLPRPPVKSSPDLADCNLHLG